MADGQGNPPEVVAGMNWLGNVADEVPLFQVPVIVVLGLADVAVAVQFWPRMLAVHETPPCGMVRLAMPLEDAHNCQEFVPLTVQVAGEVKPEELTVHPERLGALIVKQTGVPDAEDCASKCVVDAVQVTVAVPSLMVTLVPEHNEAVVGPVGEIESANAM